VLKLLLVIAASDFEYMIHEGHQMPTSPPRQTGSSSQQVMTEARASQAKNILLSDVTELD
jgi:hypothetical protein